MMSRVKKHTGLPMTVFVGVRVEPEVPRLTVSQKYGYFMCPDRGQLHNLNSACAACVHVEESLYLALDEYNDMMRHHQPAAI